MLSQGFICHINEECSGGNETLKISPAYFKGNKKIDLPWNRDNFSPDIHTASTSAPMTSHPDLSEFIKFPTSFVRSLLRVFRSQAHDVKLYYMISKVSFSRELIINSHQVP